MFTIQYQAVEFMDSIGILIPILGILLTGFIILIVFVNESKQKKYKYDALIEVSKNVKDSEEISNLLKFSLYY